jgi:hypothetical protein
VPADRPRWRRRLAIAAAAVVLLLGGAVALVPRLVDSAAVQRAIERELSARVGGKVRYDAIGLRLVPRPRAEIRGARVEGPEVLTGHAAVLDVELSLAALFRGAVRPTAIRVKEPVLEVRLGPGGGTVAPFAAYRESLGPVVEALVRAAPGMSVHVDDGRLDVLQDGRPVVALSKLTAQLDVAGDAVAARVSAASDRWRAAEARLRIAPGSLAGTATLTVHGWQAEGLLEALGPTGALLVRPGPVDARLETQTDGQGAFRATVDASSPELVLERRAQRLEVGAARLTAEVARDPAALTVSLRRLALGDLVPGATGSLRANADGAAPALKLELSALDLARLRESALRLAGDDGGLRAVADIVRAGTLRSLTIAGSGSTFAALAGAVRPTKLRVEQPVLVVPLGTGVGAKDPLTAYREALGPVVDALARTVPGLSAQVVDGRLDVVRDGRRVIALSKLDVQADVAADAIVARVTAAGDQWRAAEGRLRIVPRSLAGSVTLRVSGLEAQGLLEALGPPGALLVRLGSVDGRLQAQTDGRSTVQATVDASSPRLTLAHGARRLELGAVGLAAEVARDPKTLTISLRRLALGDLLADASGSLRARADGAAPAIELAAPALDLARLRVRALRLAGDIEGVRAAAGIVRAGTLRDLRIASAASGLAALGAPRAVRAEAELDGGEVVLADLGITVKDGRGQLAFTDGTLRGGRLAGRIGTSAFRDGALALRLAPTVELHDMRAAVDADLTEALAIARRTLDADSLALLGEVETLQGRAEGSFAFERRGGQPSYRAELARIQASGRHRQLPWPVSVSGGEVRYAPDALSVRGLSGTLGRSRVTGASADIALGPPRAVRAARGEAVLDLGELYPWLASVDLLRPAMKKEVRSLTGTATVRLAQASGPLADVEALEFVATVEPHEVRAVLTELDAPLALDGGKASVTRRTVELDQVRMALLDARVTASGRVEDYAAPDDRRLDLALTEGAAGARSLDWLRTRWGVAPAALPRPPVTLTTGRLYWSADESSEHSAQGTFQLAGDARAEIDLGWGPETLHLRRVALKDTDSDATGSLRWGPSRASVAFAGRIDHRSIVRIMARPPDALTRLQGNLRAQIDLAAPRHSTATGTLTGEGLDVLEHWGVPVTVERVRVDASGDAASIRDGLVKVAGQRVAVGGSVAVRREAFAVNLRVTADRIDADQLLRAFPRADGDGPSKLGVWDIPVEGQVAVGAKTIVVAERAIESVAGTVRLSPKRADLELTKASLCGMAIPFDATLTPDTATVSGRIVAQRATLDTVLPCILPGRVLVVTGRLDADMEYAASGPPEELVPRLAGGFRARGRAGRIQYTTLGPKILELGHVAEQLEPHETAEARVRGLDYREIVTTGRFDGGRVRLDRFTLDARLLGLGLTGEVDLEAGHLALRGVVAPFGNVTGVLRRVPIVGRVFGARIVGVPFSVSGDWQDPRVTPLGPEAIAGSFVDLLGRALNAPIQLLRPLIPSRQRPP